MIWEQYSGFANDKAIGIQPTEKGGVAIRTKKTKHLNRPAANRNEISLRGQQSGPKYVPSCATLHELSQCIIRS